MLISHNKLVRRYIGYNLLLLLFLFHSSIFAQQDENIFPLGIDEEVESDLKEFREQKRLFQRDRGRENEFLQIIPYIKNELFPSCEVNMVENNWIFTEAFRFSVHGFDVAILQKLKNRNIDILIPIEEITAPPKLANRVAISDVIVMGIVNDIVNDIQPQDGYRASIIIKVLDTYKGSVHSDSIIIRRLSGYDSNGLDVIISHDFTGIYTLYGDPHGLEVYVGDLRAHYGYDVPVGSEPSKVEVTS